MEWISVNDRLPEKEGVYLCWDVPYSPSVNSPAFGYFDGLFFETDIADDCSNVTHWMVLPDPPGIEQYCEACTDRPGKKRIPGVDTLYCDDCWGKWLDADNGDVKMTQSIQYMDQWDEIVEPVCMPAWNQFDDFYGDAVNRHMHEWYYRNRFDETWRIEVKYNNKTKEWELHEAIN